MKKAENRQGPSKWVEVRGSGIHGKGLFAIRKIPKDTRIIEYFGDKVTKAESERRANLQAEKGRAGGDGTVYVFTLNERYDIDGNIPGNDARFANHSCAPNAYTEIEGGRIWMRAARSIRAGEEITFDYGFDLEDWEDYPCRCGADQCVGFMVGEGFRSRLKRALEKRRAG